MQTRKRKADMESLSNASKAVNPVLGQPLKLSIKLSASALRRMRKKKMQLAVKNNIQKAVQNVKSSDLSNSEADGIVSTNTFSPEQPLAKTAKSSYFPEPPLLKAPKSYLSPEHPLLKATNSYFSPKHPLSKAAMSTRSDNSSEFSSDSAMKSEQLVIDEIIKSVILKKEQQQFDDLDKELDSEQFFIDESSNDSVKTVCVKDEQPFDNVSETVREPEQLHIDESSNEFVKNVISNIDQENLENVDEKVLKQFFIDDSSNDSIKTKNKEHQQLNNTDKTVPESEHFFIDENSNQSVKKDFSNNEHQQFDNVDETGLESEEFLIDESSNHSTKTVILHKDQQQFDNLDETSLHSEQIINDESSNSSAKTYTLHNNEQQFHNVDQRFLESEHIFADESSNSPAMTCFLNNEQQQFDNVDEAVPKNQESVDTKPKILSIFSIKRELEPNNNQTSIIKTEPIEAENNGEMNKLDVSLNNANRIYNAIQDLLHNFDTHVLKQEPLDTQESIDQVVEEQFHSDSINVSTASFNVSTVPFNVSSVPLNVSNVPVNVSMVPLNESNVLFNESSVPLTVSNVPLNESKVLLNESTVPVDISAVPVNISTVPFNLPTVPAATYSTNYIKSNIHPQQSASKKTMEVAKIAPNMSLVTDSSVYQEIDECDENHCKVLYFKNLPKIENLLDLLKHFISEATKELDGDENVKVQIIRDDVQFNPNGEALVLVSTHEEAVHICERINGTKIDSENIIEVSLDIGYKMLQKHMVYKRAFFNKMKQKLTDFTKEDESVAKPVLQEMVDAFFDRGSYKEVESSSEGYGFNPQYLEEMGVQLPLSSSLVIQQLHELVDEDKLYEVFSLAGEIKEIALNKEHRRARIEFDHPVEAMQALHMFKGQKLFGKDIEMFMDNSFNPRPLPLGLSGIGKGFGKNGQPLKGVRSDMKLNTIHEILYELKKMNKYKSNNENAPFSVRYGRYKTDGNLSVSKSSTPTSSSLSCPTDFHEVRKHIHRNQVLNNNTRSIEALGTILMARGLLPQGVDCKDPENILSSLNIEKLNTTQKEQHVTNNVLNCSTRTPIGLKKNVPKKILPANKKVTITSNQVLPANKNATKSQILPPNKNVTKSQILPPNKNVTKSHILPPNKNVTKSQILNTHKGNIMKNQIAATNTKKKRKKKKAGQLQLNYIPNKKPNHMYVQNTQNKMGNSPPTRQLYRTSLIQQNQMEPSNNHHQFPGYYMEPHNNQPQIPGNYNMQPFSNEMFTNHERKRLEDYPGDPRVEREFTERRYKLSFKNLPPSVTKLKLCKKMHEVGGIVYGDISAHGNAVVCFKTIHEAEDCYRLFRDYKIYGHFVQVEFVASNDETF